MTKFESFMRRGIPIVVAIAAEAAVLIHGVCVTKDDAYRCEISIRTDRQIYNSGASRDIKTDVLEKERKVNGIYLSPDDKDNLRKIAMAEAEGESVEGKALVMCVILNRVESENFADTVEGVIFETGQFSPIRSEGRWWTTSPDEECSEALNMVLDGWDESRGALYFESCRNSDNWHSRNCEFLFTYGGHRFYK